MQEIQYSAPTSVDEAVRLLGTANGGARVLGGGTDLLIQLRDGMLPSTPLLIAAKALLDRYPDPSEEQVRYELAGNLCRCTGYDKIVRAVLDAAAEMRGA